MNHLRRMSFAVSRAAQFEDYNVNTQPDPATYSRTPRRRLVDAIDQAFHIALERGDIATAEELVAVLEGIDARNNVTSRVERRQNSVVLERAQRDLNAKKAARSRRF